MNYFLCKILYLSLALFINNAAAAGLGGENSSQPASPGRFQGSASPARSQRQVSIISPAPSPSPARNLSDSSFSPIAMLLDLEQSSNIVFGFETGILSEKGSTKPGISLFGVQQNGISEIFSLIILMIMKNEFEGMNTSDEQITILDRDQRVVEGSQSPSPRVALPSDKHRTISVLSLVDINYGKGTGVEVEVTDQGRSNKTIIVKSEVSEVLNALFGDQPILFSKELALSNFKAKNAQKRILVAAVAIYNEGKGKYYYIDGEDELLKRILLVDDGADILNELIKSIQGANCYFYARASDKFNLNDILGKNVVFYYTQQVDSEGFTQYKKYLKNEGQEKSKQAQRIETELIRVADIAKSVFEPEASAKRLLEEAAAVSNPREQSSNQYNNSASAAAAASSEGQQDDKSIKLAVEVFGKEPNQFKGSTIYKVDVPKEGANLRYLLKTKMQEGKNRIVAHTVIFYKNGKETEKHDINNNSKELLEALGQRKNDTEFAKKLLGQTVYCTFGNAIPDQSGDYVKIYYAKITSSEFDNIIEKRILTDSLVQAAKGIASSNGSNTASAA